MIDPLMQEHHDREDRMKDEADRLREELESERAANEVAVAAIALTDPVIDKLTAERDEADAYILSLWSNNLLPRPMSESLRDRLSAKTRGAKDYAALTRDDDGYPSDEALSAIERWPHNGGFRGLMQHVRGIWQYADAGYWSEQGTEIHASTAGWSGNESIIGALERNHMFWALCWQSSKRGGHHVFNVKS